MNLGFALALEEKGSFHSSRQEVMVMVCSSEGFGEEVTKPNQAPEEQQDLRRRWP